MVAAYDSVKQKATETQIKIFRKYNLFGLEQEDDVVALALVNMIFRGDGRNNIREGNCFQKCINRTNVGRAITGKYVNRIRVKKHSPIITRILMNPPFALKKSDEKEYHFVDYALSQMQDGGLLFSVLPYSQFTKSSEFLTWRKDFLKKNTLISVITFPEDLFYPIGVHTIGIFIRKGVPHPIEQNVLWIRGINDGFEKKKGKRSERPRIKNDYERILPILQMFIRNQKASIKNVPELIKAAPIDFEDRLLELIPEAYLDQQMPSDEEIINGIDSLVRETAAFLLRSKLEKEFLNAVK